MHPDLLAEIKSKRRRRYLDGSLRCPLQQLATTHSLELRFECRSGKRCRGCLEDLDAFEEEQYQSIRECTRREWRTNWNRPIPTRAIAGAPDPADALTADAILDLEPDLELVVDESGIRPRPDDAPPQQPWRRHDT